MLFSSAAASRTGSNLLGEANIATKIATNLKPVKLNTRQAKWPSSKSDIVKKNGRKEMRLVASLPLMVLWSGAAAYDAHLGSGMLYREAHEALLFPQLHLSHRVPKRQTV